MGNLQVSDIGGTAQAGTPGVLRVIDIFGSVLGRGPQVTGAVSPTTTAVMPGTAVTMTLTVTGGYTSIAWTLDPDSPVVQFTGTDLEKSFVAPYIPPGDVPDVTVNVVVTNANGSSSLRLFKTVVPHPLWYLKAGVWRPIVGGRPV